MAREHLPLPARAPESVDRALIPNLTRLPSSARPLVPHSSSDQITLHPLLLLYCRGYLPQTCANPMPPIGLQPSPPIPDGGGNGRPSTGPDQPQLKDPTTEPEAELPPKLELILCRICAVLKAGHNDHKRTQGEVAVVKDQLREVKDGLAKSGK